MSRCSPYHRRRVSFCASFFRSISAQYSRVYLYSGHHSLAWVTSSIAVVAPSHKHYSFTHFPPPLCDISQIQMVKNFELNLNLPTIEKNDFTEHFMTGYVRVGRVITG